MKSLPANLRVELQLVMQKYDINTPLRVAHFLAQCAQESNNFRTFTENMNYSEKRLLIIFKKYFTPQQAKQYANKPEAIGNRVYANRMGNGNEASGEGFKYRGRGAIQLTGKFNYSEFNKMVADDITINPELVASKYPLTSAAWFWKKNNINALADKDDVAAVTRRVNGGLTHLKERSAYLIKFKSELI